LVHDGSNYNHDSSTTVDNLVASTNDDNPALGPIMALTITTTPLTIDNLVASATRQTIEHGTKVDGIHHSEEVMINRELINQEAQESPLFIILESQLRTILR
jgi:hypothetical protein